MRLRLVGREDGSLRAASQIASGLRITLSSTQKERNGRPRITGSTRFASGIASTKSRNGTVSHSRERRPRTWLDHAGLQEVGEDQCEALRAEHEVLDRDALVADVRQPGGARAVDERVGDAGVVDDEALVVAAGRDQDPRLQAEARTARQAAWTTGSSSLTSVGGVEYVSW